MMFLGDILRRHCVMRPDAVAVKYDGVTTSYRELRENADRLANALIAAGVQHQDHVAILGKNSPEYLTAYFGCANAGAIITCVNYRLADPEFVYVLMNSEANVLLLDPEFLEVWERIKGDVPNITRVVLLGAPANGYDAYADFVAAHPPTAPAAALHEDDVALQMYTSGTTGVPKGAMLTHRNLVTNALGCSFEITMSTGDINLVTAPLYHMAAGINVFTTLLQGNSIVLHREFNPPQMLDDIESEGITHSLMIPAMILFIMQMPGVGERDFSSLKQIVYGASPIPYEVLTRAMKVFGCGFLQGYGQTECTAVFTMLTPDDHRQPGERGERLLQSAGREIVGCEVRVVREDGTECDRGEWGEVIGRGPNIMKGYWKMEEETASAIRDGWLHTGDIAYMDEEGYVFIVDRAKDMIISGGENIYPREIEEVLFTHPDIADAAVIGVPNNQWGEEVKACVVLGPDGAVDEQAVIDYCRERLAHYKCPKTVDFLELIPRNLSGKVLKKDLRAPYWEGQTRQVS